MSVTINGSGQLVTQVLQAVKTSTASFTSANSNTFVDLSGLSVSITPTSATSKILVLFSVNVGQSTSATQHVRLVRNSTPIYVGDSDGSRLQDSAIQRTLDTPYSLEIGNLSGSFLDSPATTSTLTYKVQGTLGATYNGTFYLNRSGSDTNANYGGRTASSITVMEISG